MSETPLEILCSWAWSKVNLKQLQESKASPELVHAAILEHGRANRKKKQLNEAYTWHHELMEEFNVPVFETRMKQMEMKLL